MAVGPRLVELMDPPDAYEQVAEEMGTRLLELPGFDERFGDIEDAEELFEAGVEIGNSAIGRLPDTQLVEWSELMGTVLEVADEATCADLARGTATAAQSDVFRSLDIETFRRYANMAFEMARLELADAPRRAPPTAAESEAAWLALAERLGIDRAQEIGVTFTQPATASDAEVCAALRDLFDGINQLEGPVRVHILRDVGETLAA